MRGLVHGLHGDPGLLHVLAPLAFSFCAPQMARTDLLVPGDPVVCAAFLPLVPSPGLCALVVLVLFPSAPAFAARFFDCV